MFTIALILADLEIFQAIGGSTGQATAEPPQLQAQIPSLHTSPGETLEYGNSVRLL